MFNNEFLVGIKCYTYNQSLYIEDTLKGFAMQQTKFPFIAMIVDDASTDGEQRIIYSYLEKHFEMNDHNLTYQKETEYANIVFTRCVSNLNCYVVVLFLKENHYKKRQGYKKLEYLSIWRKSIRYEALCEGDDYWTDSQKLQKQVDFLESHPEYVLCCHSFKEINNLNRDIWSPTKSDEIITLEKFICGDCVIRTMTVMYRISTLNQTKYMQYKNKIDLSLYFSLLSQGLGFYMQDIMAIYRKHENGVWSGLDSASKWKMSFDIKYDILKLENNVQSAKYMYYYLMQKESRKVQLKYIHNIFKSLVKIGKHLGVKYVMKIIFLILFRHEL